MCLKASEVTATVKKPYSFSNLLATPLAKVDLPDDGMPQRISRKGFCIKIRLHSFIREGRIISFCSFQLEMCNPEEIQGPSLSPYDDVPTVWMKLQAS